MKFSASLVGLILISIAAFFGFGAILAGLEMDIGKQAVAAAFGALFIILSTKFLMEQEANSQKEYDEKRKIFERRIAIFSDTVKLINEVLQDDAIEKDELSRLRGIALELHLSANKEALEAYTKFLEKCVDIFDQNNEQGDRVQIEDEDHKECWKLAANFVVSCREGLRLPQEDSSTDVLLSFAKILQQVDAAVSGARAPLEGGLEEFAKVQSLSADETRTISQFNAKLLQADPDLTIKYTKTAISYANRNTSNRAKVVFYVNTRSVQYEQGCITCFFAARKDKQKMKEIADCVGVDITPRAQSRGLWNFDLHLSLVSDVDFERLIKAVQKYKICQDEGLA